MEFRRSIDYLNKCKAHLQKEIEELRKSFNLCDLLEENARLISENEVLKSLLKSTCEGEEDFFKYHMQIEKNKFWISINEKSIKEINLGEIEKTILQKEKEILKEISNIDYARNCLKAISCISKGLE